MKIDTVKLKTQVIEFFNHLHKNPEISWEEHNTSSFIAKVLQENNFTVTSFEQNTGVVGVIGSGKPVVALRADMDALWQEVDGQFQANHSCGHDAHMAMVLGVVVALNEMETLPNGTIKVIFQPAEEVGQGALKMVESGIAEDIDYLYGVHLRPAQETNDGRAAPAILHGANAAIIGEITGQEAHAARPHLGTNSIEVVYSILESIKNIHVDPQTPHSVKITKLIAGGKNTNIIPGNANFSIDLRAQTNEVINQLIEKVRGIIQSVGYLYNVNINTSMPSYLPAAQVDSTACNYMKQAIANTIGDQNLDQPLETTGGDDFHYYTIKRPNIKATMLGLGCDLKPGLHHPDMTFNKEVLVKGAQILLNTVLDTLENSSNHTNR